jgi:hypothetical protein
MLFEPFAEQEINKQVRKAKAYNHAQMRKMYELAIEYAENKQFDDTRQELRLRFPSSMIGDAGQEIFPCTIPLTERYLAEAATAYNKPVLRTLKEPDGSESDFSREQTAILQRALAESTYDEVMHQNERLSVLLGTSCVWYQAKHGKLRPVIVLPHDVYPIAPDDPAFMDPADPADYHGFCVELFYQNEDVSKSQKRTFAMITPQETVFYTGRAPDELDKVISRHPNPYAWDHVEPSVDSQIDPQSKVQPGQMLTFWHRRKPLGELIIHTDPEVVLANREINIMWSVLFDNVRFQGHAVPVKRVMNPSDPKSKQRHGVRFPVVMDINESFDMVSAATNYTEQVQLIQSFMKNLAVAKRLSPNDFNMDQSIPGSGFSKYVDMLPKLEAREERIRRLTHLEKHEAWPRIFAVLSHLGILSKDASRLIMDVKFANVELFQNVYEQAKQIQTDVSYNLTTPAHLYAEKHGVSLNEAIEQIEKNVEINTQFAPQPANQTPAQANLEGMINPETGQPMMEGEQPQQQQPQQQQPQQQQAGRFGDLIRRTRSNRLPFEPVDR